jgi:inosine-uridine nucleoside N-ribohydrolase
MATGQQNDKSSKIPVILDTDANNEIDDQHAMAYLFLNQGVFDILGITVNATYNGGAIDQQYQEAKRIAELFELDDSIPLLEGANSDFNAIRSNLDQEQFDGYKAVNLILDKALETRDQPLVLLAVGKLTNIALAHLKNPELEKRVRLVWLGSNYPLPGEYNLENDIPAMNYLLKTNMPFEIVTVRYGDPTGTWAVSVTKKEAEVNIAGKGPKSSQAVSGRHGGQFNRFGDYAWDLYQHIDYYGEPPSRSLYDMAAVAIVKNPSWAESKTLRGLHMVDQKWTSEKSSQREVILWENFNKEAILQDFYKSLEESSN